MVGEEMKILEAEPANQEVSSTQYDLSKGHHPSLFIIKSQYSVELEACHSLEPGEPTNSRHASTNASEAALV